MYNNTSNTADNGCIVIGVDVTLVSFQIAIEGKLRVIIMFLNEK